jgi:putative transposase
MSANQARFPIAARARVLGVSKAGYYAWRHRPPSAHARADEVLLTRIKTVHISSRQTYGAPRVHAELRAAGERHGRKRIARLMRAAGLVGASRRRGGPITTQRDKHARPAPDLVDRDFQADGPNRLWVADITYVPTAAGFLYLAVVVDVWSRRVVGWAMANHLRAELVLDALNMALGQRRPREVIHHSDQSPPRRRPGVANIPRWLSASAARKPACGLRWARSGMPEPVLGPAKPDPGDNALCESFFATLECELLERRRFASQLEARMACFSFIEGFYNPTRRHSALGYRSPICFEQEMQTDQQPATP